MAPGKVSKPSRSDAKPKVTKQPPKKVKKSVKVLSKDVNYSLCIPTTLLSHCKNLEQVTYTVYQVAKAATMFNVGEIVVLDLGTTSGTTKEKKLSDSMLIASLLQYFVTPPYLVNTVFKQKYLSYFREACKLPRLPSLPFMRYLQADEGRYREGLAIRMSKPGTQGKKTKEFKQTKYVNVGKSEALELKAQLVPANVRVTVDVVERKVVSPKEAYGDFVGAQSSYGYQVRIAKNFGDVFMESAFADGYSQALWVNCDDYYYNEEKQRKLLPFVDRIVRPETASQNVSNVLLVFGKWRDVQKSFTASKDQFEGVEGAHQFFDGQVGLPGGLEGCIPIQDACMVSLAVAKNLVK
ncbi:hypothetical protein ZYGR_0I00520 [Zygosaccharomyces rouxii]|uniref:ZYRO0C01276p n=2 Tax=Zygosaccharomyces rouxii TaxID=4956 RepID=C5DSM0_ZYGRC|nr:uncharacterized protein ZYRO0C01276g [Zygosaccharomyces rouxii]KAH9202029.1 putative RNA methyltransferase [Zygosaccharomyces rouxii]GAV47756.1 hypothetical protein ZYGR_0I00520 [Zygosaccharomyces rouxii]CAR26781.1 ZYRO0C01276p [Zygosaccharomyces rouxii]